MKFFLKKKNTFINKKSTLFKENNLLLKYTLTQVVFTKKEIFSNFFLKNGCSLKSRLLLGILFKNLNNFFYSNKRNISENFQQTKSLLNDIVDKKKNSLLVFNMITNLIKPPFVVKSILIPKKLRKKTKQKYLIKIVYKNESKRIKSSYKQLYYYSNRFTDGVFKIRLYKAVAISFLDWKNSYLFKLKTMVFKKYFKF